MAKKTASAKLGNKKSESKLDSKSVSKSVSKSESRSEHKKLSSKKSDAKKSDSKKFESKKTELKKSEPKKSELKPNEAKKADSKKAAASSVKGAPVKTEQKGYGGGSHVEVSKEADDEQVVPKNKSVVSMIESETESIEEASKAEKVSKVKPVKIERGNLADEKAKWAELNKKYGKDKAVNYKMSEKFSTMIPLQHKVLGWGFVLTNENDRLEVLFETGIRMLISNYKN